MGDYDDVCQSNAAVLAIVAGALLTPVQLRCPCTPQEETVSVMVWKKGNSSQLHHSACMGDLLKLYASSVQQEIEDLQTQTQSRHGYMQRYRDHRCDLDITVFEHATHCPICLARGRGGAGGVMPLLRRTVRDCAAGAAAASARISDDTFNAGLQQCSCRPQLKHASHQFHLVI